MASKKVFYVTTPIYYVNDVPHIGHAYTNVAADAVARYHRLKGEGVFFLTGTDEHGQKIEKASQEQGYSSPKELADRVVVRFKKLWEVLNISNDDFIRTTEERHEEVVKHFVKKLMDKGDIYKGIYEGWYCISCETFFGESQLEVKDGKYVCPQCGKPVSKLSEESYFFKLSAYQDKLLKFYEENPDFVLPRTRMNEVVSKVREGLKDLSISRTTTKWGVPIPGDPEHVIYVWVDALLNYISAPGYLSDPERFKTIWPADVHIIGKDILWFHAVIWPALLMAAGLEPPKRVFAHGWWTVEGEKMSKSKGNVVDPFKVVERYGADSFRYFLLREVPFGQDGDFSIKALVLRHNSDLANDLGNLAHRTISQIHKFAGGKIPAPGEETEAEKDLKKSLEETLPKYHENFEVLAFHEALKAVWEFIDSVNKYIDTQAPWSLKKEGKTERLNTVLYYMAESVRIVSHLVEPVIPETAKKIRKLLKAPEGKFEDVLIWKVLEPGTEVEKSKPLFPRLEVEKEMKEAHISHSDKTQEAEKNYVEYDDFAKLDLRVATIKEARKVEGTDKLIKLTIDLGSEERTIVAGIAQFYKPEELPGKQIIVVANLKPRKLRGITSQGMLLAATDSSSGQIVLLQPEKKVQEGSKVS